MFDGENTFQSHSALTAGTLEHLGAARAGMVWRCHAVGDQFPYPVSTVRDVNWLQEVTKAWERLEGWRALRDGAALYPLVPARGEQIWVTLVEVEQFEAQSVGGVVRGWVKKAASA